MRRQALPFLLVLLLPTLSGCLGGDEAVDPPAEEPTADGDAAPSVNATATAPSDLSGGAAPHIHDYWGGTDRVTLFDDAVGVSLLSGGTFRNVVFRRDPALGGTEWELPEGATVYEGTGLIEITATWTDPTITGLAVAYKPANEPETIDTFRDLTPLASGQPFAIEVTPAMTDMPHEAVSRWKFFFSASGAPAVAQGSFGLKVEIVRMRDVSLFPGHPDMYEDTDRYLLEDADFAYRRPSVTSFMVEALTDTRRHPIVPDVPVPMETRVLLVELTVTSVDAGPAAGEAAGFDLVYRGADGQRYLIPPLETEGDRIVFALPVEDRQVDSPYGTESAWRLAPWMRETDTPTACDFCFDAEIEGHAVVTAFAVDPTGGRVPEPREFGN